MPIAKQVHSGILITKGITMRICKDCGIEKELNEFHKSAVAKRTGEIWYRHRCKVCHNIKFYTPTDTENPTSFKKGHKPVNPFKKGMVPWNKGKPVSEEMRSHLSNLQKGRKHSPEEIEKRRKSLIKDWDKYVGYDRHSAASRRWSREVRSRDGFICQKCFSVKGKLHAHHIKSWKDNEVLRFDVSNGITLCIPCHKLEHKDDIYNAWNKGKEMSEESKVKLSNSLKGRTAWNKGIKTGKSSSTSFKKGKIPWNKGLKSN
jgi:hypothetical protein